MMTWEDFKLKFSKYHVPQGLIKKMRDEFRELKQGRMFVVEYRDKLTVKPTVAGARRSPSPIHAAPSLATATRRFLTIDNIASHPASPAGTSVMPPTPYSPRSKLFSPSTTTTVDHPIRI
ncbi:hypothetical protein QYE76_021688 [Lolium multiflorum]|uniref:Retrotransposon gag domain-containing protein n=1 Tax=Lolium multiflorum TaxID=4521 RepID=A0AAD8R8D3_LOLMU|nr:hypothetical protein QYE76_021688 [Lolium multiflorum]